MRNPNHQCIICGNAYYACNDCEKVNSWRIVADKIECYQTYLAFIKYREEKMEKDMFAEVLRDNGFEGKSVLPDLQVVFDDVLGIESEDEDETL